jgi:hypothetical protein
LGFRGSLVFISFGLRLNVRTTGVHFILHQSDQPSLGFSYIDVPQRCRIAPRFQIMLRLVQNLTPILERFAINLCAALRIEVRHRHLRSCVYMCLRLSDDVRMGRHGLLRTPSPCLTLSTSITKCFREIDLCSMRKRTEVNQYRSIYRGNLATHHHPFSLYQRGIVDLASATSAFLSLIQRL